jgi:glycosyltransferase involved in cell wall biosynthesis
MKILFVVSSYSSDGAGAGMSVRHLAEAMVRMGHESVVVRLARDDHELIENLNGVKIYHRPIFNVFSLSGKHHHPLKRFFWHLIDMFNPWAARDFYQILKTEKPDIVNTSVIAGFSTSLFWATKLRHIPLVHTLRDYYLMCPQNAMFREGCRCEKICTACKPFKVVRTFSGRWVDLYLANSDFIASQHKKFNALPIHKPCYTQFNMNADDSVSIARNFPSGRDFVFGFIGRVTDTKGIEILLRAFSKSKTSKWKLLIAGYGSKHYIEQLKLKYPDPRVDFIGHQDADSFYKMIDILVCPSLYEEPLPRVVYEGYRAGLPVIAARTGGTPEIIDENINGFVYEPNDEDALLSYMIQLSSEDNIYNFMSAEAVKKAEKFKPSHLGKTFIKHLEGVLSRAC